MTAPALPPADIERLARICGLLGSSHDGERSAAAYQATQLLRRHGLSWRELVEAAVRQLELLEQIVAATRGAGR